MSSVLVILHIQHLCWWLCINDIYAGESVHVNICAGDSSQMLSVLVIMHTWYMSWWFCANEHLCWWFCTHDICADDSTQMPSMLYEGDCTQMLSMLLAVWQAVAWTPQSSTCARHDLRFYFLQSGRPAGVLYLFKHPTPYAHVYALCWWVWAGALRLWAAPELHLLKYGAGWRGQGSGGEGHPRSTWPSFYSVS
jgi:hypothetical protein